MKHQILNLFRTLVSRVKPGQELRTQIHNNNKFFIEIEKTLQKVSETHVESKLNPTAVKSTPRTEAPVKYTNADFRVSPKTSSSGRLTQVGYPFIKEVTSLVFSTVGFFYSGFINLKRAGGILKKIFVVVGQHTSFDEFTHSMKNNRFFMLFFITALFVIFLRFSRKLFGIFLHNKVSHHLYLLAYMGTGFYLFLLCKHGPAVGTDQFFHYFFMLPGALNKAVISFLSAVLLMDAQESESLLIAFYQKTTHLMHGFLKWVLPEKEDSFLSEVTILMEKASKDITVLLSGIVLFYGAYVYSYVYSVFFALYQIVTTPFLMLYCLFKLLVGMFTFDSFFSLWESLKEYLLFFCKCCIGISSQLVLDLIKSVDVIANWITDNWNEYVLKTPAFLHLFEMYNKLARKAQDKGDASHPSAERGTEEGTEEGTTDDVWTDNTDVTGNQEAEAVIESINTETQTDPVEVQAEANQSVNTPQPESQSPETEQPTDFEEFTETGGNRPLPTIKTKEHALALQITEDPAAFEGFNKETGDGSTTPIEDETPSRVPDLAFVGNSVAFAGYLRSGGTSLHNTPIATPIHSAPVSPSLSPLSSIIPVKVLNKTPITSPLLGGPKATAKDAHELHSLLTGKLKAVAGSPEMLPRFNTIELGEEAGPSTSSAEFEQWQHQQKESGTLITMEALQGKQSAQQAQKAPKEVLRGFLNYGSTLTGGEQTGTRHEDTD